MTKNIYDYDGERFELGENLKLQIFEQFKNAAILEKGGENPIFEGYSIIDSADLHGCDPYAPKIRALIFRNGGKSMGAAPRMNAA